ncbi:MAG: ABC transporter ATP-binding protein/permease [Acidobacteria bacterium]|jgi:ATP-binding cassette subfamily B protein|nr:ABC transporter ATP-binding protein/permease [Acidobacteriota bacterium]
MSTPPAARRLVQLLRPERGPYLLGLASLLVVNLTDVLAPLFLAVAIDRVAAGATGQPAEVPRLLQWLGLQRAAGSVGAAVAAYVAIALLSNLFRFPMLMNVSVPSHRVVQGVRRALVDHLLRLARPFFDRSRSGDLMALATSDTQAVRMALGPGVLLLVDTALLVVLVLGTMATLSVPLTLAAMIPLPAIALFTHRVSQAEFARFGAVQEDLARLTERARETYAGIRVLQGFAREEFERERFAADSRRHLALNLRLARVRSLFDPSLEFLLGLSTLFVLVAGGVRLAQGALSVGSFTAFLYLVGQLSGPMIGFGWAVSLTQRGRKSLERIDALLGEPIEIRDAPGAVEAAGPGRLEVHDLTFRYPGADAPALAGVSFTLPAGGTLGVIGPVGGGKSTLAALLVRLYEPPPGAIRLDAVDVRRLSLASLRGAIAVAPQDTFLFGDTVQSNIALAAAPGGFDPHDARRLARLAAIDDEIDALPEGYATLLGERGVNLSGGQRQRLAIARAVGAAPRVLVLDDCLAAVDAATEAEILANLDEALAGRSGIVISQRVRAVRRCDEILVLEGGRVIERGTHAELVAHGGWYAAIAQAQARISEEAP